MNHRFAKGKLAPLPWADGGTEAAILMVRSKERCGAPTLRALMESMLELMGTAP